MNKLINEHKTNTFIGDVLIMSFSPKEVSLNRENGSSIKGSWLYKLARKYEPKYTDEHIEMIGFDHLNRIEVMVSIRLFEALKNDKAFLIKALNIRRLRSAEREVSLLEYLCYPRLSKFDNDLDRK